MSRATRFLIFLVGAVLAAITCNVLAAQFGPSVNMLIGAIGALIAAAGLVIFSH